MSTSTSGARRAYSALALVVALLVLVQAVLAGRALFGSWSITVHGVVGNATFGLAALLVVAAAVARVGNARLGVAVVLALVLTTQIGLGYAGRERPEAAAWHVPMGVLAFGLAVHQVGLARTGIAGGARRNEP